jgi:predicted Fe-Mo cluster-binding NifX family protein
MKIAVITDDGKSISQHFGRAPYYMVFTVDDKKITNREMRDKLGHNQFSAVGPEEHHGEQHGLDEGAHNKHAQMAGSISDCQVLLCGGMGMGAYESMRRLNIQPMVTNMMDIEAAVQEYIEGKLVDHTEKLH